MNTKSNQEKALIGVAIGFLGMGACVALALMIHLTEPYWPEVREFLLWAMEPQLAMGMGFGMILGALIVWSVMTDRAEDLL